VVTSQLCNPATTHLLGFVASWHGKPNNFGSRQKGWTGATCSLDGYDITVKGWPII